MHTNRYESWLVTLLNLSMSDYIMTALGGVQTPTSHYKLQTVVQVTLHSSAKNFNSHSWQQILQQIGTHPWGLIEGSSDGSLDLLISVFAIQSPTHHMTTYYIGKPTPLTQMHKRFDVKYIHSSKMSKILEWEDYLCSRPDKMALLHSWVSYLLWQILIFIQKILFIFLEADVSFAMHHNFPVK